MHLDLNGDKFSLTGMTAAINTIAEVPTVVGGMGLFDEEGITTLSVSVEKQSAGLSLVAQGERGGPGETIGGEGHDWRDFRVPHFERADGVSADEVQNIRAFGTEDTLETLQSRITTKMARHTRDFDFTQEYMRLGAVKGVVLNKAGGTIIDCFAAWGITAPAAIDFVLGTAATDLRAKCVEVLDKIDDGLEGLASNISVEALAGDTWFHRFVTHPKVEDTYKNWEAAAQLRGDARTPFVFGGISFRRIHSRPTTKAALNNNPMIGANEVRFVPKVPGMFKTFFAPADYNETVNTVGLPRYAKMLERRNGKGYDIEMQTNTLSMCMFPQGLQQATSSN